MKQIIKLFGLLALLGIVASVSANPLYVDYTEKYDVNASVSGDGTTSYNINNLTGYITINNSATDSADTLSDVWVAVNISNNITGLIEVNDTTPKGYFIKDSAPDYTNLPNGLTYIHIPILRNGDYVILKFGIDTSITGVPILVDEAYSATKIPAGKLSNWTVYMNISRNTTALPTTNTAVNVGMIKFLSNDPNKYGSNTWNFLNITDVNTNQGSTTTWDGPYATTTAKNDSLNWTGVVLNNSQNGVINFTVCANNTYQDRNGTLTKYGFAVIFFNYDGTVSNTSIKGVYAAGNEVPSATKNGPYKNETTGKYTLWYENASFKNNAKQYYFNLTKVKIWAVNGSNPANVTPFNQIIPGSTHITELNNNIVAPNGVWNSNTYNFTFDGVPVVWANFTFTISNNNYTLLNRTVHESHDEYGSNYIIVEEIYVVGSYLIKVTKHIVPNSDGTYDVYIVVENIGSQKSPYVYAYDLIPNNFTVYDMWVNKSSMLAQNPSGNNYSGTNPISNSNYNMSYYWALYPLSPNADGDGNYTDSTEINNNQTVVIHYKLNGTGEFRPTDAFIVGIDPTHSLLPTTSPKTVLVSGAVANNFEPLLMLLSGLVGAGVLLRRRK